MGYLAAAVVIVGAIAIVNLIFTLAVIRKLREMTAPEGPGGLPVGADVPAFSATTTTGDTITHRALATERTLVGFFSTDCDACTRMLPAFVTTAQSHVASGGRSLAIVVEGTQPAQTMVAELDGAASVVVEPSHQPDGLSALFDVHAFPYVCLIEDNRVVRTGPDLVATPNEAPLAAQMVTAE